jgi:hypothetical protein
MTKPELILTSKPDDDFLTGGCSSCPDVQFKLTGNTLEHKKLLRVMFDNHLLRSHKHEDSTTQAKP